MPMTTNATTATTTVPQVDEKGLRRIAYVLGGATVFCGAMGVYTSLTNQPSISDEFMARAQIVQPAKARTASSFTVNISSSQFLR